jgi:predicted O-linked N-acetylglucosamine transferase (SPINDLY family)
MATISEALAIAIQHHQAGRFQVAEQIYRQILEAEPNQADAIHFLGVLAHQAGQHAVAVQYIQRAIALDGNVADFHNNLAEAYLALQRIPEAVASYRRALELKANYAEAHYNLGNVLKDQGKLDEAIACYRRAIALKPDSAEAHNNLGIALKDQGNLDDAIACYRRALELKPEFFEAHNNLGNAFRDQARLEEAVACCRRALALKPESARAHNNLGNALKDQRKLDEAVACYCRARELKSDYAEAHNNLGVAFQDQGKLDEAVACYRRALELKSDYAEAHSNLGHALKDQGSLDDAVSSCRRALELKPNYAAAQNNLGNALKDQGNLDDAVACYRRALELKPDFAQAHSNLLAALQYRDDVTPTVLAEVHAEYDRRHAAPLGGDAAATVHGGLSPSAVGGQAHFSALGVHEKKHPVGRKMSQSPAAYERLRAAQHASVGDRHGRLRLGFVSPDLGRHPVGYFLVRVLENLRQTGKGENIRVETICYSDRIVKDDLTRRLQAAATQWRDTTGTSDQRLAEPIRSDAVDILFDLAGHTAHNRLLMFARKPAPIQITWLGYVGTTGLRAMDYILADGRQIPPESEVHYREKVLRLPDGYVCFDAPEDAPPVGPLPAWDRGQVSLGCFHNPAKITPRVIEIWARILRRLPTARLVFKYKGWNDRGVAWRYAEMFAAQAIDPGRVEFLGWSPHAELLAAYQDIDLALDPFPYSGGLTTCEALWMGVPVVTCPGETFASRHSLSHLTNVGLTETIAQDLDQYVELAVRLAGDLPQLAALRDGLRQRMAASPLCDGKRFAANLTYMMQRVWEQRLGEP